MVAAEQVELLLGDGGALRGDGSLDADGPGAQGVELAFDHDEGLAVFRVLAGAVEIEEQMAFGENRGLVELTYLAS